MRGIRSDRGASSAEYALLAAFIAAVAVGAIYGLFLLVELFFDKGVESFPVD